MKKYIFFTLAYSCIFFPSENTNICFFEKLPKEMLLSIICKLDFSSTLTLSETSKNFFALTENQKYQQFRSQLFQIDTQVCLSENFGWAEGIYFLWNLSKFNEPLFAIENVYLSKNTNDLIKKYVIKKQLCEGIKLQTLNLDVLLQDFLQLHKIKYITDYIKQVSKKKLYTVDWKRGYITKENINFLDLQETDPSDFFIYYKNKKFNLRETHILKNYLINSFDSGGITVLAELLHRYELDVTDIKNLIQTYNWLINVQTIHGDTPLLYCMEDTEGFRSEEEIFNIAKELIAAGIHLEITDKIFKNTVLLAAAKNARFELVKLLIEAGADYSSVNTENKTILQNTQALLNFYIEYGIPLLRSKKIIAYKKIIEYLKQITKTSS